MNAQTYISSLLELKDIVLLMVGVVLGWLGGIATSWAFERRQRGHEVQTARASSAQRGVQWFARYLLDTINGVQVVAGQVRVDLQGIDDALSTLDEARPELVMTEQDGLLEEAEDVFEGLQDWLDSGAPPDLLPNVRRQVQDLLRHAGGSP